VQRDPVYPACMPADLGSWHSLMVSGPAVSTCLCSVLAGSAAAHHCRGLLAYDLLMPAVETCKHCPVRACWARNAAQQHMQLDMP
jgi:hypothetical protein